MPGPSGFVLEPLATTLAALIAALPDDVLLLVDPNCRPSIIRDPAAYRRRMARVLVRADVVKVSVEDLAFLRPGEDVAAGVAWLVSLGPKVILVTDGGGPVRVVDGGRDDGGRRAPDRRSSTRSGRGTRSAAPRSRVSSTTP